MTPQTPLPLGVPGNWQLKFDDEFNGTTLDLHKWQPNWYGASLTEPSSSGNHKGISCDSPSELSEGGGVLKMSATVGTCHAAGGPTYPYSASLINTYGKFMFTYGYMEARMYVPTNAQGIPEDMLTFSADGLNWPQDGESTRWRCSSRAGSFLRGISTAAVVRRAAACIWRT